MSRKEALEQKLESSGKDLMMSRAGKVSGSLLRGLANRLNRDYSLVARVQEDTEAHVLTLL